MSHELTPEGLLLWSEAATSLTGTTTVEVSTLPTGEMGISLEIEEYDRIRVIGLALNRGAVQKLRDALTTHLVGTAPEIDPR